VSDPLWAAMQLTDHPDVAEALVRGLAVPRGRLRPAALKRLGEETGGGTLTLTPELVVQCEATLNGNGTPAPRQHSWIPVDLVALGAKPPEPPTLGGVAYPGRRHLWSGEPEALKTWLALCVAAEEIRNDETVVYVDFENGAREILSRLHSLGLSDEQVSAQFLYLNPNEPIREATGDIDALLSARRPALVVIDAFASACELHGLDENTTRDVETFYRTVVDPLRAHGAAVICLDHVTKSSETRGRWAIGSQRKVGAADVHLGLELITPFGRGRTGKARLVTRKDRPGHLPRPRLGEFELTSDPKTHRISWSIALADPDQEPAAFRPTGYMERVSIWLEQQSEPRSRKEIRDGVTGKTEYVLQAADALIRECYAVADGDRNGWPLYRSAKPYREADDAS
jgi:hypothetical protein